MTRHLLDVNVFCALVWPRHEGHTTAHDWCARSGHRAWAINPLTQLGVLGLLTNPTVKPRNRESGYRSSGFE
jgi:predicted nucleic acid-binding protein